MAVAGEAPQRAAATARRATLSGRIGATSPARASSPTFIASWTSRRGSAGPRGGRALLPGGLAGQRREAGADLAAHLGGGHELGQRPQQRARRAVGHPQQHPRAPLRGVAEAQAAPLLDPAHAGPHDVAALVVLGELDEAAHLGRPRPDAHPVARAHPRGARGVLGLEGGETVQDGGVGGRVGHERPHPRARRRDRQGLLDPHPSTGRRRSRSSAVRTSCIAARTSRSIASGSASSP